MVAASAAVGPGFGFAAGSACDAAVAGDRELLLLLQPLSVLEDEDEEEEDERKAALQAERDPPSMVLQLPVLLKGWVEVEVEDRWPWPWPVDEEAAAAAAC